MFDSTPNLCVIDSSGKEVWLARPTALEVKVSIECAGVEYNMLSATTNDWTLKEDLLWHEDFAQALYRTVWKNSGLNLKTLRDVSFERTRINSEPRDDIQKVLHHFDVFITIDSFSDLSVEPIIGAHETSQWIRFPEPQIDWPFTFQTAPNRQITTNEGDVRDVVRSTAVTGVISAMCQGKLYVLAGQRGTGTPEKRFWGAWAIPGGYLDYDETIHGALFRECYQETGLDLYACQDNGSWTAPLGDPIFIYSDPTINPSRQNITIVYKVHLEFDDLPEVHTRNAEPDEVIEASFLEVTPELVRQRWAFNHADLVEALLL